MSSDTNALFRRPEIAELRDRSQEDPRESTAGDHGLSNVGPDGDIGCIINGTGLALATMDMIKPAGEEPANFLDIGGGASPEPVVRAFRTVLADGNVPVIVVNIFAGINRCDRVAQGVVQARQDVGLTIPVVVRLAGANVGEGQAIIKVCGLPLISADTLAQAAAAAVAVRRRQNLDLFLRCYPADRKLRLIGPNCAGVISPGQGVLGHHAAAYLHARPHRNRGPVRHLGVRGGGADDGAGHRRFDLGRHRRRPDQRRVLPRYTGAVCGRSRHRCRDDDRRNRWPAKGRGRHIRP